MTCRIVALVIGSLVDWTTRGEAVIPGIVVGLGIGLAAYGSIKFLFGRLSREKLRAPSDAEEPTHAAPVLEDSPVLFPPEEEAGWLSSESSASAEAQEQTVGADRLEDVHEPEKAPPSPAKAPKKLAQAKTWYLIRTSKGTLRACRCSKSEHTVAGPFESKLEARKAKEQFSTLTVQTPDA